MLREVGGGALWGLYATSLLVKLHGTSFDRGASGPYMYIERERESERERERERERDRERETQRERERERERDRDSLQTAGCVGDSHVGMGNQTSQFARLPACSSLRGFKAHSALTLRGLFVLAALCPPENWVSLTESAPGQGSCCPTSGMHFSQEGRDT